MKKDIIKVRVTKIARRTCGGFLNNCGCLLATSLKRAGYKRVEAYWENVKINNVYFRFSTDSAQQIHGAYAKPVKAFEPFTVILHRANI